MSQRGRRDWMAHETVLGAGPRAAWPPVPVRPRPAPPRHPPHRASGAGRDFPAGRSLILLTKALSSSQPLLVTVPGRVHQSGGPPR